MDKTALVLFGSPHENGHTAALLEVFLNHLKEKKYEIKIINAYQKNVKPCTDCSFCKSKEGCVYSDTDDIDSTLQTCDLLIIATPVYNASFPAPLKTIFDRFQRYFNAKYTLGIVPPVKKAKQAVALLTQGSDISFEETIKKQLNPIFKLLNAQCIGQVTWSGTDNKNFNLDKFLINSNNKIRDVMNKL